MSNSAWAEIYFMTAMMILILILCVVSVYIFFRQLKREKGERAEFTKPKKEKTNETD
jgi:heme/copper-type cytochrome/quinol oxidase subunit 2